MSEMYPEGVTETELNDILWFEDEWIFDTLGIETEEQKNEEKSNGRSNAKKDG